MTSAWWQLEVASLEQVGPHLLISMLRGFEPPIALDYMTRVVGYYSMESNWNRSKLGELIDRRAGTYSVKEAPSGKVTTQPDKGRAA